MAKSRYGNSVIYKFLIVKIAKLVKNSRGRLKYAEYFDNIIYDIFGVKHFAKKINESYDNRDIIDVLESVGSDQLMKIMNNAKLYEAMRDLIAINYRIDVLRKEIRKQNKKDKRNKSDMKEYKYLTHLYEDSIKYFRKRLGIKNSKNSYKRRYQSLNSVVRDDYEYDYDDDGYTSILLRGDDDLYFDDEDDYDDEYEATSELEDFVNRLNGKPEPRRNSRRTRRNNNRKYFDSAYSDDDYDIDDDYDDDEDFGLDGKAVDHLNRLTEVVTQLSEAVQVLMTKNEYDTIQKRKKMYQDQYNGLDVSKLKIGGNTDKDDIDTDLHREMSIITSFIGKLSEEQVKMKSDQKTIAEALDHVIKNQEQIAKFLSDEYDDDEDDVISDDQIMRSPVVSGNNEIQQMMNRYPDLYEEITKEKVESQSTEPKMKVEDIIDEINKSGETVVQETKVETVEVTNTPDSTVATTSTTKTRKRTRS